MSALYELTEQVLDVLAALEQCEGDEQAQEILREALAASEESVGAKFEQYAKAIKTLERHAKACKDEAAELAQKAKSAENRVAWLKQAMESHMQALGVDKVAAGVFTVALQANGGKQPVEVLDELHIPSEFWVQTRELDRTALRDALERGREIAGARLGERGRSVRVR